MKLEDYVRDSFVRYPGQYIQLGDTYADSEMAVLNHLFLVNGNGLEWAHTRKPEQGGYLVDPVYYKRNYEWLRKFDPPYGKVKCDESVARYFLEQYMSVFCSDGGCIRTIWEGFECDMPDEYRNRDEDDFLKDHIFVTVDNAANQYERNPYPFYDRGWPFAEIDHALIKPDWRNGMLRCFRWAMKFYSGEKPFRYPYEPSKSEMRSQRKTLQKAIDTIESLEGK